MTRCALAFPGVLTSSGGACCAGKTRVEGAVRIDVSGRMGLVEAPPVALQDRPMSLTIEDAAVPLSGRGVELMARGGKAAPVAASPYESTMGAVVVGPAASEVRRTVGPVAWCALEYLAASPPSGHGDKDTVAASVRSVAAGLGVSKKAAHRALSVLRAAGLVEPMQSRCGTGRFDAGCYRLAVPAAVVARVDVGVRECTPPAAPSRAGSVPGRARAGRSRSRRGVEQLSLLPGF